jgi:hypothetical protein
LNHITLDIFRAKAADLDTIGTAAFDYVGSYDVGIYRGAFDSSVKTFPQPQNSVTEPIIGMTWRKFEPM